MNNKSAYLLRVVACIALLSLLCGTASLGDSSPVGTWRHGNGKNSLQLDKHHSFLLADSHALFDLELRGTWGADGTSVVLKAMQVRLGGTEVKAVPSEFPSAITGTVSVASNGRRVLKLEGDEYLFVSDRTTIPGPWEPSPQSKADDIQIPPFIAASLNTGSRLGLLPSVDVQCATNGTRDVEISITGNARTTGFGELAIWQEGQTNYLWIVDLRHRGRTLTFAYANPKNEKARQLYPSDASVKPKHLSRDKRFFIRVDVSYKLLIPPSLGADPMYFSGLSSGMTAEFAV